MTLIAAALISFASSIIVAGLFLPVYSIIVGGWHSCLAGPYGGWHSCLDGIPISALIYGPLFSIIGTPLGTPVVWVLLKLRD